MYPSEDAPAPVGGQTTRLPDEGPLAGVAAGLGRRLAIEPNLIRLAFVILAALGGAGFLAYLGVWLLMPGSERASADPDERSALWQVAGGGLLALAVVTALSMMARPQPFGLLILTPIFIGIALLNIRSAEVPTAGPTPPPPSPDQPVPTAGPTPPPPSPDQPVPTAGPTPPPPSPDQQVPPPPQPVALAPDEESPTPVGRDAVTTTEIPTTEIPTTEIPTNATPTTEIPANATPTSRNPTTPIWLTVPPDPTTRIVEPVEPEPPRPSNPDPASTDGDSTTIMADRTDVLPVSGPLAGHPGDHPRRAHWAVPRTATETVPAGGDGPVPPVPPPGPLPPAGPSGPSGAVGPTPGGGIGHGPPLASLSLAAISLLVGASLVLGNVAGADVSPVAVAGLAVLLLGGALTVSAFRGRAAPLIALAAFGIVALVLSPALDGGLGRGIGSSRITVESADQLAPSYRLGLGGLRLDLRSLDPGDEDMVVSAEVGTGVLEVLVPDDVPVIVHATTTLGVVSVHDRSTGGLETELTFPADPEGLDGDGKLVIEAKASLGAVDIQRYQRVDRG